MDEEKKWFDVFRVIFELVSAFGGIGLTLGVPYVREVMLLLSWSMLIRLGQDNFSFVGSFKPLSKLVVIVIMYVCYLKLGYRHDTDDWPCVYRIRGRHRGLPVAVDRAVQLPKEMVTAKKSMQFNEKQPNSTSEAQQPSLITRIV
jgi:Trk-type K+ transport system membrane component